MANGWLVFFALLLGYLLLLLLLVRTRWMERLNMSLFLGVLLMVRTTRGRNLLNWFAKARTFFDWFAKTGLYVTFFAMAAMTLLLILQLPLALSVPEDQAPSPSLILGIPGINPIIPLGYGIAALVFAVVVHEFSHGIMARVYDLPVKTMGLLFFIVPVGAFVEPDEEALEASSRSHRMRVFSAGPLSNLVFAVLFAAVFSGALAGGTAPVEGIPVQGVAADGPANASGLQPGWVITHLNGNPTPCLGDFQALMGNTTTPIMPNTTVTVTVIEGAHGPTRDLMIETVRRGDVYTNERAQQAYAANPELANDTIIGFSPYNHCEVHTWMASPFSSGTAFLGYVSLPFFALAGQFPLSEPFNAFLATPEVMPAGLFWGLANLAYWLFWINLMLGLTNALPLVPLDGGHMFRDWVDGWLEKRRPSWTKEQRGLVVNRAAGFMAVFLLLLILAQFIGPAIGGYIFG